MSSSLRRSSRDRRQTASYYEEAKQELEGRQSVSPVKEARRHTKPGRNEENNDDTGDMNDDDMEDGDDDEDDESSEADDEDHEEPKRPKTTPSKKVPNTVDKAQTQLPTVTRTKKPAKVAVQVGGSTLLKKKTQVLPRDRKSRGTTSALTTLARKVLDDDEQDSLLAKLLHSKNDATLNQICLQVIQDHRQDANQCQIQLVNLIFRVVGGSALSALTHDTQLEQMDMDDWAKVITDLVDDMRYCAAEHVLICADPSGAVVTTTKNATSASQGVREFRTAYQQFWYTLAQVALEDTGRFEIEMLRDWLSRTHELTLVAQPDIRAAAVLASLQMSLAALHRTIALQEKEHTTRRQLKASDGKKAEGFQYKLDALQRSRQDLEDIVASTFSTVFMNRYRDSNPFIRADNIDALSKMTLLRPDIYLSDKYLKYIGWTLSDKEACVRMASLSALAAPFHEKKTNLSSMENVIRKFLPRLADCTIDIDVSVQEKAMALFLLLDRANFLEDFEDDALWAQINNRALAKDASPAVRRDALQFILDQLEAFDYDEEEAVRAKNWAKDKSASLVQSSNKTSAKQLATLAGWVAHALTDGPIPIEDIRIQLTDYIVDSLRDIPEHKSLATNWSAMIMALNDCAYEPSTKRDKVEERIEIARERVMVRILSRAVLAEVNSVAPDFLQIGVDPELAGLQGQQNAKTKPKGKGNSHEILSSALLKALPDLLVKYKTDTEILVSLSSLPRFILPSVLSLPQHKHDFVEVLKNSAEIYAHSINEKVLLNISDALAFFVSCDHVRAQDVHVQLRTLTRSLSEKLMALLMGPDDDDSSKQREKSKSKPKSKSKVKANNTSKDEDELLSREEREIAISLSLRRLRILAKRLDVGKLLDDSEERDAINKVRDTIVVGLSARLESRQIIMSEDCEGATLTIPEIWKVSNTKLNSALSDSVSDALQFLLVTLAWSLREACANDPIASADVDAVHDDDDENEEIEDRSIVEQRDQLVDFICLCFEQFLPEMNDSSEKLYTAEHVHFANSVQTAAFQTSGDLRALLPKVWAEASSPLLRACALTDDTALIGGSIRYFRSQEHKLRQVEDQDSEDVEQVCNFLLPFCRTFVANWSQSNRREAGYAMAHIVGSGQASQQILTAMSRIVKKMDPVHLLETHMACLRTSFDDWLNSEPEDIESDRPSDEEMAAYAFAEKEHRERFDLLVQQAGRLSQSLGVGKTDPQLEKPLLGFCREGVRFAFSTDMPSGEEPLLPGGRLTFLLLLAKYVPWVRRSSTFREVVVENVRDRDEDLRLDPEYDQAHQDDLDALTAFRKTIGLNLDKGNSNKSPRSAASISHVSDGEESDGEVDSVPGKSTGTTDAFKHKRPRLSGGSSIGSSIRSTAGNVSALSPLMEVDDDSGEDDPPREIRKRKFRGSSVADDHDIEEAPSGMRSKRDRPSVGSVVSEIIQEESVDSSSE